MKIRVYYEDTDAGGIVYHTNYIKFCERARSETFFERGMMPGENSHSGFVVKDINASFLATAKLGEMLDVRTAVLKLRNSSVLLRQEVYKEDNRLFSMDILLVYVNKGKPVRIPESFRKIFEVYD